MAGVGGSSVAYEVCEQLCTRFTHRGATTSNELDAACFLQKKVEQLMPGVRTELRSFACQHTYLVWLWWALGSILLSLLVFPRLMGISTLLSLLVLAWVWCAGLGVVFQLDGRDNFLSKLPPVGYSHNVIAFINRSTAVKKNKLILMAHYDSAPASFLYLPSQVKHFCRSLKISGLALVMAPVSLTIEYFGFSQYWTRMVLLAYLAGMVIMSSADYLVRGYTNGAADNASGVGAAVEAACSLFHHPLPEDWEVELVLTGAEEALYKGSLAYYRQIKNTHQKLHVVNIDNVGAGDSIVVVDKTESYTPVFYNKPWNSVFQTSAAVAQKIPGVTIRAHTVADFDSIFFARNRIPSVTISAQCKDGTIPQLHRPGDTMQNVNKDLLSRCTQVVETICRQLAKQSD
ncbi:M20/M25/M40 family metallo-hydrolase [Pelomyxa schiedti]|nr:M20/M25/M40 family metallo-hydrolase [Pelomyxa schiedti]